MLNKRVRVNLWSFIALQVRELAQIKLLSASSFSSDEQWIQGEYAVTSNPTIADGRYTVREAYKNGPVSVCLRVTRDNQSWFEGGGGGWNWPGCMCLVDDVVVVSSIRPGWYTTHGTNSLMGRWIRSHPSVFIWMDPNPHVHICSFSCFHIFHFQSTGLFLSRRDY